MNTRTPRNLLGYLRGNYLYRGVKTGTFGLMLYEVAKTDTLTVLRAARRKFASRK